MRNDGRIAWLGGLAVVIMVPYVALAAASVLMIVIGMAHRKRNPISRDSARRAMVLAVTNIVIILVAFVAQALTSVARTHTTSGGIDGWGILLAVVTTLLSLYITIAGPLYVLIRAIIAAASPVTPARAHAILSSQPH